MSTRDLQYLTLRYISLNFSKVFHPLTFKTIELPSKIVEMIIEWRDDLTFGITEEDLEIIRKIKTQLSKFSIQGDKIKNLKKFNFLRDHPIESLELVNYLSFKSLIDLKNIVSCKKLKELTFVNKGLHFEIDLEFLGQMRFLKKLDISGTIVKDERDDLYDLDCIFQVSKHLAGKIPCIFVKKMRAIAQTEFDKTPVDSNRTEMIWEVFTRIDLFLIVLRSFVVASKIYQLDEIATWIWEEKNDNRFVTLSNENIFEAMTNDDVIKLSKEIEDISSDLDTNFKYCDYKEIPSFKYMKNMNSFYVQRLKLVLEEHDNCCNVIHFPKVQYSLISYNRIKIMVSIPSLRNLTLQRVSMSFQEILNSVHAKGLRLPSLIAEMILESRDVLCCGISDEDLQLFSRLDTRLHRFAIHANKIKDIQTLSFLIDHPIIVLELKNSSSAVSLDELKKIIDFNKLKEFSIANRVYCRLKKVEYLRYFKSLRKLDLSNSGFTERSLNLICREVTLLEDLNIDRTQVKCLDSIVNLKYLHTLKALCLSGFQCLKEVKQLKHLHLNFNVSLNLIRFFHFFWISDWQLDSLSIMLVGFQKTSAQIDEHRLSCQKPKPKFFLLKNVDESVIVFDRDDLFIFKPAENDRVGKTNIFRKYSTFSNKF
ncbi:DgyrCDS10781 [Dimorphilus gyrociliatus]|uniref:DgyrCDS10781 n=1 Tax=Dimorphilus gyrociliatus TaxID=2664684 RepID=A0A7I8W195_9ANNE|nr:DgyrCDS10781 [Dimorphilus gyrociliatus]